VVDQTFTSGTIVLQAAIEARLFEDHAVMDRGDAGRVAVGPLLNLPMIRPRDAASTWPPGVADRTHIELVHRPPAAGTMDAPACR
jgi:hypothetical protein